jgi:amidase
MTAGGEIWSLTASTMADSLAEGALTSSDVVDALLERIDDIDRSGPTLRSVIETNPEARSIAAQLDAERNAGRSRGPLHGVPVLVKDNVDTADEMHTTAGSLALSGNRPISDAELVENLRAAGLVLLGKTNLSEWANIRSTRSTSGWSARGGLTLNPWALDRNAGGSSAGSGSALAAALAPLAVGTETDGSIVCPASVNGVVGFKPTVGAVSRRGVIPISHSQDSPGPMARTVRDTALLLGALTRGSSYIAACSLDGLPGLRVGVVRGWFGDHPVADALAEQAVTLIAKAGAEVVDPVDLAGLPSYDAGDDELTVLLYELHADLDAYLRGRPPGSPRSLAEVVAYNRDHADVEMVHFGQELFEQALGKGGLDESEYLDARRRCLDAAGRDGIDAAMGRHTLDVLVGPAYPPAWKTDLVNGDQLAGGRSTTLPAIAGYPILSLPCGLVDGLPVGLSVVGGAGDELTVLRAAYAFEHALGLGPLHPEYRPPATG